MGLNAAVLHAPTAKAAVPGTRHSSPMERGTLWCALSVHRGDTSGLEAEHATGNPERGGILLFVDRRSDRQSPRFARPVIPRTRPLAKGPRHHESSSISRTGQ